MGYVCSPNADGPAGISNDYLPAVDMTIMLRNDTILRLYASGQIQASTYSSYTGSDSVTGAFLFPYKNKSFPDIYHNE